MLDELPIRGAWRHIHGIDWHEYGFDLRKAYVCALFSELTYYLIPDFELEKTDRINVIPCLAHQSAVREQRVIDFDQLVRSLGFEEGQVFTVIRRYAIVVGVRMPDMIIVAIRGTKYLYDWLVNFRVSQYVHDGAGGSVRFHSGFFRAISACFEPVSVELRKFIRSNAEPVPLYVTGHSLGGALAAIMHAIWGMTISKEFVHEGVVQNRVRMYASYTFGMPRYGDLKAITIYREPYHLYNELDIVPTVPPKWLGFESCFNEFKLDGRAIENVQKRESIKFANWVTRLLSGTGIKNHSMEGYRERIALGVGTTP
jgi:hypothetical protein